MSPGETRDSRPRRRAGRGIPPLKGDRMDFGDILDEWDKMKDSKAPGGPGAAGMPASAPKGGEASALEAWLAEKGVEDKDADEEEERPGHSRELRRLASLKPQAVLDLHGMTEAEAESAISAFINSSAREGLEKVLVIHGKGLHSEGGRPVLKKAARRVLEAHPLAGRLGEAGRGEGCSGALWVAIRRNPG